MAIPFFLKWLFREQKSEEITVTYRGTDEREKSFHCTYNPADFKKDPYRYQHSLALLSLAKAMSSYNGLGDYQKRDKHITHFHEAMGFTHIHSNHFYKVKPEQNSVGVQFAYKKIWRKLRRVYLVSIAIRSGGYEAEWGDNFRFGPKGHHQGFQLAAKMALDELEAYLRKEGLDKVKHIKFWISGYSRGAAVSNLVAAELIHQLQSKDSVLGRNLFPLHKKIKGEVYAYTFETPSPAIIANQDPIENCIFNLCSTSDIVPYTPFGFLEFQRYGITIPLEVQIESLEHLNDFLPDFESTFFVTKKLQSFRPVNADNQMSKADFIKELLRFFEFDYGMTREFYVANIQEPLAEFAAFLKSAHKDVFRSLKARIKLPVLIASLISLRTFREYLRGLLLSCDELEEAKANFIAEGLAPVVLGLIKADRPNHYFHMLTLLMSMKSLFDEHDIELIYVHLFENNTEPDLPLLN